MPGYRSKQYNRLLARVRSQIFIKYLSHGIDVKIDKRSILKEEVI